MARLFEPYVTTWHGRGGMGLGLAIGYRIVHEHGGTITDRAERPSRLSLPIEQQ